MLKGMQTMEKNVDGNIHLNNIPSLCLLLKKTRQILYFFS